MLGLTGIADQIEPCAGAAGCLSGGVLGLIDYLWQHFGSYLDVNAVAPAVYQKRYSLEIEPEADSLARGLREASISTGLKACILGFLEEMIVYIPGKRKSFRSLFYVRNWLNCLSGIDFQGTRCEDKLHVVFEILNFNNLAYVNLRCAALLDWELPLMQKVAYLKAEKIRLVVRPFSEELSCHPDWPPMSEMIGGWIKEELLFENSGGLKKSRSDH